MNKLEQNIIEMYKQEINLKHCQICENEAKRLRSKGRVKVGPKTLFHIGDSFEKKRFRPVFVGKTDWFQIKDLRNPITIGRKKFYNCLDEGEEWYKDDGGVFFWRYIKDITQNLKLALDDYAVSNLAKCDVIYKWAKDKYVEDTPDIMYQNCIKIFEKEIKILKPTHIIFFTNTEFDDLLDGLRFWFKGSNWHYDDKNNSDYIKRITNRSDVKERNRKSWWWHRIFYENSKKEKPELHFLRTRHPQGMPNEFKEKIIEWLIETK